MIVVQLSSTQSYVIELRRRIGYDRNLPGEGVLVYFVDLTKNSGHGPVRVIDSNPNTVTFDDAPFRPGTFFEDPGNNVYLAVVYDDGSSVLVVIGGSKLAVLSATTSLVRTTSTYSSASMMSTMSTQTSQMSLQPQNMPSGTGLGLVIIVVVGVISVGALVLHYRRSGSQIEKRKEELRQPQPIEGSFCIECGARLPTGSQFCGKCGTKQP